MKPVSFAISSRERSPDLRYSATCFWIMFRFKDYTKSPASIFSGIFKVIFTFIIPIAFVAYYPSLMILEPGSAPLLSKISPLIGIFFFYLSYKFRMPGVKKYDFTGS